MQNPGENAGVFVLLTDAALKDMSSQDRDSLKPQALPMIVHTKAFATYRALSQQHINFSVLVCAAVPALRPDLNNLSTPLKCPPDHFKEKTDTKAQLAKFAANYQAELGRTNLITIFSYFESYVRGTLEEIVQFHGGEESFRNLASHRASAFLRTPPTEIQKSKRKLQEPARPSKRDKYLSHSKTLHKAGFRFPTELLAHFGSVNLIAKSKDKTGMRAWEIPTILQDCLLYPISSSDRKLIEDCRSQRNKIAHGKPISINMKESLKLASDLHGIAAKIDQHLVEHFFVLQSYV